MVDWMREYLQLAGDQIRWKQARQPLLDELADHLECQRETGLQSGLSEEAARAEALKQMGDAILVGQALDQVHRPKPQWGLLCLTVLLAVVGAVLRCVVAHGSTVGEPERVLFYLALGLIALFGCYILDVAFWGRHAVFLYVSAVLLGICSLLLSPQYAGASYYTRYFVVMLYPVVYAALVWRLTCQRWLGFGLSLAALLPLAVICLLAPSLLGLLLLGLSAVVLLSSALVRGWFRIPRRWGFGVMVAVLAAGVVLLVANGAVPALQRRLTYALNPDIDPMGYGYMGVQIREGVAQAKLWGSGSAAPLPGWDTDALLASFLIRFGWIPFCLVLAALTALLLWSAVKMLRQPGSLGQLVSLAVLLTLGVQVAMSVMTNLGIVLLSATCPFVMGNLHTVMDLALVGVMLSAFRRAQLPGSRRRRQRLVLRIEIKYYGGAATSDVAANHLAKG